ncbi:MAG: hypothetical protein KGI33_04935 [Thaumarchaeota archaeon]|nr:hypothetical protein [Nitrososphaerota archaeon]
MGYKVVPDEDKGTGQARRCGRAEALDRARWFLEQHYSVLASQVHMEKGRWIITAQVGLHPPLTKCVSIDPASGAILGCA